MIKTIKPSLFYSIDLDTNEVFRISGISTDSLKQTDVSVRINLYDKKKVVKKEWLKWLAYYEITLPMKVKDSIWDIRFYKHKLKSKVRETDKRIVLFKNPVYADDKKEFRILARYPDYAISIDGRILDIRKKTVREFVTDNMPEYVYPIVSVYDRAKGKSDSVTLHRLVALAWCEYTDFIARPIVNHKDRNRHNYHADNLEWVSYSGNNSHLLMDNGYNRTFKVRNIDTGEISYLTSLTEASAFIGRSRINTVHTPLNRNTIWVGSNGRFELKSTLDKSPWLYDRALTLDNKRLVNKYIVKYKNGNKEYYRNRYDLCKTFLDLTGSIESKELIKRILKIREDIEYISKINVSNVNKSGYQAKNITTGEVFTGTSHNELAKLTNLSKSTITKALMLGDNKRVFSNFIIRPYSEDVWDTKDLKIVNNLPIVFKVYRDDTLVYEATSIRELAKKYLLRRDILMRHFKDNNNFRFNNYNVIKH